MTVNAVILSDGTIVTIGYGDFSKTLAAGQTQVSLGSVGIPNDPHCSYIVQDGALVARATPLTLLELSILANPSLPAKAQLQYNAAIAAGCQIVHTSIPTLNGTYQITEGSETKLMGTALRVMKDGTFSGGAATLTWLDINNQPHTFPSTTEFMAFAEAIAGYVSALNLALEVGVGGGEWVPPTQPLSIA